MMGRERVLAARLVCNSGNIIDGTCVANVQSSLFGLAVACPPTYLDALEGRFRFDHFTDAGTCVYLQEVN